MFLAYLQKSDLSTLFLEVDDSPKMAGHHTLRLDTEEKTGKKIGELPAPVYISKKRMTNGKLNSPQNISPKNENISNSEQKSIPLYLYDIFETKLSMEYPEDYLKNKMYRDAVQSGDIEKAKKILLHEAKTNGYDITPKNMEEISEITYDENGYLVPLSKRFNKINLDNELNKSIIQKMTSGEYNNKELDAFVTDKSGFVDPEKIAAIDLYGFEKAKKGG